MLSVCILTFRNRIYLQVPRRDLLSLDMLSWYQLRFSSDEYFEHIEYTEGADEKGISHEGTGDQFCSL